MLPGQHPLPILLAAMNAFQEMHRDCKPTPTQPPPPKTPTDWIEGRDTGVSSVTIWSVLMNVRSPYNRFDPPRDPSDFGRCYRLLEQFPDWKPRLPKVADRFPFWGPYIREWDSLTAMYDAGLASDSGHAEKLYLRLQELEAESRALQAATHP